MYQGIKYQVFSESPFHFCQYDRDILDRYMSIGYFSKEAYTIQHFLHQLRLSYKLAVTNVPKITYVIRDARKLMPFNIKQTTTVWMVSDSHNMLINTTASKVAVPINYKNLTTHYFWGSICPYLKILCLLIGISIVLL